MNIPINEGNPADHPFYQYLYETAKNEFANNKVIGYEDYYNLTKSLLFPLHHNYQVL